MSDQPVRVAFCPLLFAKNGGTRGRCDAPHDCGECELLTAWVEEQIKEGYELGWECVECLKQTKKTQRWLPGFYQASKYRGPPWDYELVEPDKKLDGCERCGWGSSLLQLVLRRSE